MTETAKKLIEEIEAFCRKAGISETAFGRNAVKDPNLLRDLRNGRSLGMATVDRIREAMKPAAKRAGKAA